MSGGNRYRYVALAEWEVCAALAGELSQKRLPTGYFRVTPKPGALIWVQEPFVWYLGSGHDREFEEVCYRADAGPAGGIVPCTTKHRRVRPHMKEARDMWRGASRLTLEITRTWLRPGTYWEVGERQREGLQFLRAAHAAGTLNEAWQRHWRMAHGETSGQLLMLQFRVHRMNIAELLASRTQTRPAA